MPALAKTLDGELPAQIKTAAKALLLLDAFGSSAEIVGVSELSRRSHMPKSTTHRVLRILVDTGFVHHLPSGYQLSRQVSRLAISSSTASAQSLRTALLPCLVDLHHATEAPVSLSVVEGGVVRCIERVHGLRQAALAKTTPDDVAVHTSASGKVLLAFALRGDSTVEPMASHVVMSELDRIRADGIAIQQAVAPAGITMIAAPVLGTGHAAMAALSVLVTGPRVRLNQVATQLRSAARICTQIVAAQRRGTYSTSPAA
ncbi:helix-turn-helix domain-containing protein [Lentzea alba]|uniref:IclR family transcriptional regulator n=1 Tax=Lentzea alba TaxID=2714351 RepID=UPI0039BF5B1A